MSEVEVEFPYGAAVKKKMVPAHMHYRTTGKGGIPTRLVPDDMEGWRFLETVDGRFIAVAERAPEAAIVEVFRDW